GVHVRLRAGPRLPDDEREMVVELAIDNLLGRLDYRLSDLPIETAELHVGLSGRTFDDPEGTDYRLWLLLPADLEVGKAPLGLRAPVLIGRNFDRAEGIRLDTHVRRGHVR